MIQIDASVNVGNSGGPLIDPINGNVLGVVSRKVTGLTAAFDALRTALQTNISLLEHSAEGISINWGGYDPLDGALVGQQQILNLLDEIERQANVGTGYAVSSDHLLADQSYLDGAQ
jgi:hypothetical protein